VHACVHVPCGQRDPEVFFGPSVFLEAWGTKPKTNTHFPETTVFFGPAAFGGKARNPLFLKMCGFRRTLKGSWSDGVMGDIVAEDRQEGVERF
jgi:hypothetical protein